MADFGQPVAAGVQGPQTGIQTLSGLLGLRQQQLSLAQQSLGIQQQQQELQSQTAQAQVATIKAQQTKALSQLNPKQWVRPDGSLDINAASQSVLSAAPNLGPEYLERLQTMSQGSVATQKAYLSLNQDLQNGLRDIFGTWGGNPNATPADLAQQLEAWQGTLPKGLQAAGQQIENHVLKVLTGPNLVTGLPHSVDEQKAGALAYARAGLAPTEVGGPGGIATGRAGVQSTGTQLIPTSSTPENPVTKQSGPPIANIQQVIHLNNGQVATYDPATKTYVIAGAGGVTTKPAGPPQSSGQAPMTAENDPNRPGANAPIQLQQQWQKALADTSSGVESTRQADTQSYGNNMAVAQDIRALSRTAGGKNIGPGTPEWTRFIGTFSSRLGGSQGVTDVQTLESFLDRQAASMTSAMGLPATNLGNEQARTIAGNIGMQVGALRAKNDYNEALAQGLHYYRSGLDKAIGLGPNPSPTAYNRFRSEWARYFNPTAIEYELAKQRGDKQVMDAIAKSVSPSEAKRIMADADAMQTLATQGKLK